MENKIFVTKSFLPNFEDYIALLRGVFDRGVLTNQGVLVQQLESELEAYLAVDRLQYVCNGTVAIQLALRAFDLHGAEIITTPFSYVATTSSLLWEGCKPKFVDIEPEFFTIAPDLVEAAITPNTKAILAVHVFGKACDVERLSAIANKYNLKLIYDGAHAFGTIYNGKSLLAYGDVCTLSFHATKLFHTVEGGACVASDPEVNRKIDLLKRFGHVQDEHFMLGINAKQSEFHAAMGITNLKHVAEIISARRKICELYTKLLSNYVAVPRKQEGCEWNYAYYPVLFESNEQLVRVFADLEAHGIYPRRYFYPSLNLLPYLEDKPSCPNSEDISKRIACLPLSHDLSADAVATIASIIKNVVVESGPHADAVAAEPA